MFPSGPLNQNGQQPEGLGWKLNESVNTAYLLSYDEAVSLGDVQAKGPNMDPPVGSVYPLGPWLQQVALAVLNIKMYWNPTPALIVSPPFVTPVARMLFSPPSIALMTLGWSVGDVCVQTIP